MRGERVRVNDKPVKNEVSQANLSNSTLSLQSAYDSGKSKTRQTLKFGRISDSRIEGTMPGETVPFRGSFMIRRKVFVDIFFTWTYKFRCKNGHNFRVLLTPKKV